MWVFLLILGLFLVACLIVVHELGHFLVARRNGVAVEEFGIGFPPKALGKKTKAGYILSLNWLPLGGFVRLKGEHDADEGKGSFGQASLWVKTKIMVAGVAMNLVAAFVLLTILAIVGMPQIIDNQFTVKSDTKTVRQQVIITSVESGSPASSIGLKPQDRLVSIGLPNKNLVPITTAVSLPDITQKFAGQTVVLNYYHDNQLITKDVKLRTNGVVDAAQKKNNPVGYLGVAPIDYTLQKSTWSSPIVALGIMKQITVLTFKGIWAALSNLFQGNGSKASAQVGGPVVVVQLLKSSSLIGYQLVLMIVAVISLSLALFNILPIPALDGGRLFFTLVPRLLFKKPLKQTTEDWIHGTGLAVLVTLILIISFVEIKH